MSPRPDFQFVRAFCDDQDYQFLLEKARSDKKLNNSTVEALRLEFRLDHLEINRRKWLLRSMYLSVWHHVCILQAQGMKLAAIVQDLRQCTGLPYEARMIGDYAKEDFFKSLHEGTTSTIPIIPSPDLSHTTSAADSAMSSMNKDGMTLEKTHFEHDANIYQEEERHEFSTVPAASMKLQQEFRHLLNIDFMHTNDVPMPLEGERCVTLLDGYAMEPDVGSSLIDKSLEFEQTSQPSLRTPNLDPMSGPGPYFLNHQFSGYMQPQDMMNQADYQHADFDQVQAMNPGDNDMQDFRNPFANEQYNFQNMHEETSLGPNNLFGPRLDSGIGQGSQHIDPRLLDL